MYYVKKKRSRHVDDEMDVVQPVCPSQSEWRALDTALDINNTAVRIYQPSRDRNNGQPTTSGGQSRHRGAPLRQWFYTVTCRNDVMASSRHCPGCCLGVDHGRCVQDVVNVERAPAKHPGTIVSRATFHTTSTPQQHCNHTALLF